MRYRAEIDGLRAVAVVPVILNLGDGFPGRMTERYAGDLGHAAFYRDAEARFYPCEAEAIRSAAPTFEGRPRCFQSKPGLPVTVAVLGDSHSEHLYSGVADGLPDENVAIYLQNAVPFRSDPSMQGIYAELARNPDLKSVIFAMHWPRRFTEIDDPATFRDELNDTLSSLKQQGLGVVVVGDLPWFASEPPNCKYEVVPGNLRYCTAQRQDALTARQAYTTMTEKVAAALGVPVVPVRDLFCGAAGCSMVKDGQILFRDSNHLNAAGADLAGGRVAEAYLSAVKPGLGP